MKAETQKQQFIEMRIEGKSFKEITKALSISQANLISWNKETETRNAINEGLAIQLNDEVRNLEMGAKNRIATILKLYKRVLAEIEQRDLADVPTDKLIQLSVLLNQKINEQNVKIEIGVNESCYTPESGNFFNVNTLE